MDNMNKPIKGSDDFEGQEAANFIEQGIKEAVKVVGVKKTAEHLVNIWKNQKMLATDIYGNREQVIGITQEQAEAFVNDVINMKNPEDTE